MPERDRAVAVPTDPPEPCPLAELAELSMSDLLTHRAHLRSREGQLSYWRRVVQGRHDVLCLVVSGKPVSTARIADSLASEVRPTGRSSSHVPLEHTEPLTELSGMDQAWERSCRGDDTALAADTLRRLALAERWLTDERLCLHVELDATTAELTRRAAADPAEYLAAATLRWTSGRPLAALA